MGCTASKAVQGDLATKKDSRPAALRDSSSSSPALAEMHKKAPTNNGKLRIDGLLCESLCKTWVTNFKITEGRDPVTVDMVLKDALAALRTWPRGDQAGQLLVRPEPSNVPIAKRGVKVSWLLGAWQHLTGSTQKHLISTRMFVELLVRPILVNEGVESLSLFDFIPPAFRADPNVFVSHAWDGYFRHLLFYPESLKKVWPTDCALWLDIFAYSQLDDGPNPERLEEVKQTIQSIGRTVVVFPGDGTPEFAILPATRSWCVFEMLSSKRESIDFRVGLHGDLDDVDFHHGVLNLIDGLTVQSATTSFVSDKRAIEGALALNDVTNTNLKSLTRLAFAKRYEGVPTSPRLSSRLSDRSMGGRLDSMSDIYATTGERKSSSDPNF